MPSSRLVQVEVGVGVVGVGDVVGLTFLVGWAGWLGGWRFGE